MEDTPKTDTLPTGNEPAGAAADRGEPRGWWRPVALIAAVVLILILARFFGLGERLGGLRMWIQSLGTWGYGAFVILYALAVVAALPGAAITVAAGALYGSVIGVILVSIGSTLGASVAFLMSRYFARDATARWLAKNERLRQLDLLTERHGAIIVAITRLIPLFPFNLLNYAFGLTRVPFGTYVFWSWLCMIPGTVLYVVGADALTKGVMQGAIPWPLIVVLAAAALLIFFLTRFARKKLSGKKADET